MAGTWVRNPNNGFVYSSDQISTISAILNNDNVTYSYTLYLNGQTQPFYTSTTTYPTMLAATLAAYEILVIELN
jgi:hypothetical protein